VIILLTKQKEELKEIIINEMKGIGVYKEEFDSIVDVFAGMLHQYQVFEKQFAESGYKIEEAYTNKAGATNMRKVPLYTAMESLRKDIVAYSDRLCLNPKSLGTMEQEEEREGTLANVLKTLEK